MKKPEHDGSRMATSLNLAQVVKRPADDQKIHSASRDASGTSARTAAAVAPAITVLPVTLTRQAYNSHKQHEGGECSENQKESEATRLRSLSQPPPPPILSKIFIR